MNNPRRDVLWPVVAGSLTTPGDLPAAASGKGEISSKSSFPMKVKEVEKWWGLVGPWPVCRVTASPGDTETSDATGSDPAVERVV
ncbi:hypothetical protein J6590_028652 [Homalodisca vitripennis]|nr:hypothetical protein J6590_028652 [Homalodisca vitripennis]